jgi:hypothetical protein
VDRVADGGADREKAIIACTVTPIACTATGFNFAVDMEILINDFSGGVNN